MIWLSFLGRLEGGGVALERAAQTLSLSCSASGCGRWLDLIAVSVAVMMSMTGKCCGVTGKCCGVTAKLRPLPRTLFSSWLRVLSERFLNPFVLAAAVILFWHECVLGGDPWLCFICHG